MGTYFYEDLKLHDASWIHLHVVVHLTRFMFVIHPLSLHGCLQDGLGKSFMQDILGWLYESIEIISQLFTNIQSRDRFYHRNWRRNISEREIKQEQHIVYSGFVPWIWQNVLTTEVARCTMVCPLESENRSHRSNTVTRKDGQIKNHSFAFRMPVWSNPVLMFVILFTVGDTMKSLIWSWCSHIRTTDAWRCSPINSRSQGNRYTTKREVYYTKAQHITK